MLKVLKNVCTKRAYKLDDEYIDDQFQPHASSVSDIESELIMKGDKWLWKTVGSSVETGFPVDQIPKPIDHFLKMEGNAYGEHNKHGGQEVDPKNKPRASSQRIHEETRVKRVLKMREKVGESLGRMVALKQEDIDDIVEVLKNLEAGVDPMQKTLDGKISNNLWIVKPAGKSRGRGIATFKDLPKILDYVDAKTNGGGQQWIVQKYMENPLTIANRKFDVRQWVLVTDWNPLTIWFYDDCYCR